MFGEGYNISMHDYCRDLVGVRNDIKRFSSLNLSGMNSDKDGEFFDKIGQSCSKTTEKLVLSMMKLKSLPNQIQIFPLLSKITFFGCEISDKSILQFNEWCPNITQLVFQNVCFIDDNFDVLTSTEHIFPLVKSFAFDFHGHFEGHLNKTFLAQIDEKFPMLESLELNLRRGSTFDCIGYKTLHFKNLKKLNVFTFGKNVSLAIFNRKLKELKFAGLNAEAMIFIWIKSCKNLAKLTLDLRYLDESNLSYLKNMECLREVKLNVKQFNWKLDEMLEFVRNNRRLKILNIECDRKSKEMQFDDDFEKKFDDLIKQRRKLSINLDFLQGKRTINISEKGIVEKMLTSISSPVSSSESSSETCSTESPSSESDEE